MKMMIPSEQYGRQAALFGLAASGIYLLMIFITLAQFETLSGQHLNGCAIVDRIIRPTAMFGRSDVIGLMRKNVFVTSYNRGNKGSSCFRGLL